MMFKIKEEVIVHKPPSGETRGIPWTSNMDIYDGRIFQISGIAPSFGANVYRVYDEDGTESIYVFCGEWLESADFIKQVSEAGESDVLLGFLDDWKKSVVSN